MRPRAEHPAGGGHHAMCAPLGSRASPKSAPPSLAPPCWGERLTADTPGAPPTPRRSSAQGPTSGSSCPFPAETPAYGLASWSFLSCLFCRVVLALYPRILVLSLVFLALVTSLRTLRASQYPFNELLLLINWLKLVSVACN